MKKSLLLCAAAFCSLMASAGDGIVTVGANITVLPASQYDSDVEWKAWTWVYNFGEDYGEWNSNNPNYNQVLGEPAADSNGNAWYEPGYNMSEISEEVGYDEMGEPVILNWEEHAAPFSSDANYKGRPSYQWTTSSIMADIYVRRTFTTNQLLSGPVYLACGHDDAPSEFYINGELVYTVSDGWNNDDVYLLTDEQKALIKLNGEENIIAFHVHQNWGGAFADCGLYTKVEGGLEMGYVNPWEGKVLFNNHGGYNFDGRTPSNNPKNPWSRLYEAQEGDEYTFTMAGASEEGDVWQEQLHFKTPIRIEDGKSYTFKCKINADADFTGLVVKLTDNDNDEIELAFEESEIIAGEDTEISIDFNGEVNNFKVAFDFGGGQPGATVTIKEMSLTDDSGEELWIGTHYFNYFYMTNSETKYYYTEWEENPETGETIEKKIYVDADDERVEDVEYFVTEIDAPELTGRTETLAWTLPDFDDSMWDEQMMPTGNMGYNPRPASNWPGNDGNYYYEGDGREGENTNYWIRRNFTLDKVNERLSYALNVCHDDNYETYVNGHLLQQFSGWTNGKNPKQVHIPAKYLREGQNVIATYIQQNWGGRFYDCGINVEEVDYESCAKELRDAIDFAKVQPELTNKMHADVNAIIDEANHELATNKDAAEVKNYAKEMKDRVQAIFNYSGDVRIMKETYNICHKMDDKGYWGTALTDAAAALDTCATAGDMNRYLEPLRKARKRTAMERHTENYIGCVPEVATEDYVGCDWDETAPKYYIYNVGEKLFLGGGESWGTHLALEYISNPWMLVQKSVWDEEAQGDVPAGFRIETFRPNGNIGTNDFANYGGYVDCDTQDAWELIPVEGKENVFNIARYNQTREDGSRILIGFRNGTDNGFTECSDIVVDTDMKTAELESNQWMFITREEMLSFIKDASVENPVDLSFLITNPGYDQRLAVDGAWFWDNYEGGVGVWGRGGNHPDFLFEAWNSKYFNLQQDIMPIEEDKALPAGSYLLTVQGYYRDGSYDIHVDKYLEGKEPIQERAIVYAGQGIEGWTFDPDAVKHANIMPATVHANEVPGLGKEKNGIRMPDDCATAAEHYFKNGLYKNQLVFTIPEETPGSISIGIYKGEDEDTPYGDWVVVDNWRIKYLGGKTVDEDAIKGVTSDEINTLTATQKGIYNLLGQKMSKTQQGVNIVNGKKIIKK